MSSMRILEQSAVDILQEFVSNDVAGIITDYLFEEKLVYVDGVLNDRIDMYDGKKFGQHIGYFANGEIKFILSYADGKLDGECMTFYPDGGLCSKFTCKKGKRINTYRRWFPSNGRLTEYIEYKGGYPIISYEYSETGDISTKIAPECCIL